jgi:hypothetical protein
MSRVAGGGVLRAGFRGCAAALASHGVVGVGWGEAEEFDTATDDLEDGVNCAKRGGGGVGGVLWGPNIRSWGVDQGKR